MTVGEFDRLGKTTGCPGGLRLLAQRRDRKRKVPKERATLAPGATALVAQKKSVGG